MKNCKNYKIYRLRYHVPKCEDHVVNYNQAILYNEFKKKFVDKFCKHNYQYILSHYTHWAELYGNERLTYNQIFCYKETADIGFDMLVDDDNVYVEYQWSSWYLAIPLDRKDMIDFVEENKPPLTKVVQKL